MSRSRSRSLEVVGRVISICERPARLLTLLIHEGGLESSKRWRGVARGKTGRIAPQRWGRKRNPPVATDGQPPELHANLKMLLLIGGFLALGSFFRNGLRRGKLRRPVFASRFDPLFRYIAHHRAERVNGCLAADDRIRKKLLSLLGTAVTHGGLNGTGYCGIRVHFSK